MKTRATIIAAALAAVAAPAWAQQLPAADKQQILGNVAANEKAYLEEYGFTSVTGLPEADRCLEDNTGMAQYLDRMSA